MVPDQPKAGVVLLHGIHADRRATLSRARLLWQDGFAVLSVDLQAHGASTGDVVTFGYRESQDAVSAVRYMRRWRASTPNFMNPAATWAAASASSS